MKTIVSLPLRTLIALAVVTGLIVAISALPSQFGSVSASAKSGQRGLPNFDIRSQHDEKAAQVLNAIRERAGKDASTVSNLRSEIANGEALLRTRMPGVTVEYNDRLGNA